MKKINIGDIYIYKVPFVDNPKKSKPRPILIISKPNSHGDLIAIAGTSKIQNFNNELYFTFSENDLNDNLLHNETTFPLSKKVLVSKSFFKAKVGCLKKEKLKEVLKELSYEQTKNYYKEIHEPEQN